MRIKVTANAEAELRALYEKHGRIDEKLVVAASKKKSSALHGYFLWGDTDRAAAIGRHEIARSIIMQVHVIEKPTKRRNVQVTFREREFHGLGDGYHTLADVLQSKELTALALDAAIVSLSQFQRKYRHLAELSGVMTAIDDALAIHRKKAETIAVSV